MPWDICPWTRWFEGFQRSGRRTTRPTSRSCAKPGGWWRRRSRLLMRAVKWFGGKKKRTNGVPADGRHGGGRGGRSHPSGQSPAPGGGGSGRLCSICRKRIPGLGRCVKRSCRLAGKIGGHGGADRNGHGFPSGSPSSRPGPETSRQALRSENWSACPSTTC